jgi:glycerol kinase
MAKADVTKVNPNMAEIAVKRVKYRIVWKSKDGKPLGSGEMVYTKERADDVCAMLNNTDGGHFCVYSVEAVEPRVTEQA